MRVVLIVWMVALSEWVGMTRLDLKTHLRIYLRYPRLATGELLEK